ncbi:unnamed protein product [Macrosiphum euphorbiae]|uniref:TTF-type domain-containing protein n=1 Tax=Macrosiphum euphorbiae TaxID=13131 RepID=A0AAV0X3Z8_9HEMI|nr:unnamed protein product [Macrosiphum euphorbiae]
MKRLDIRTFFSSSTKNISTNIETEPSEPTEPIENPENNDGNNSLCLNKSKNENSNPVIDLGSLESGPKQPILSYPLKKIGKQNRSFSSKYYEKYFWIEYSVHQDSLFCFVCRHFDNLNTSEDIFKKIGFNNWKKLSDKLEKHSNCKSHCSSIEKYTQYKQSKIHGNVHTQLSDQFKTDILNNQMYIQKIIDIILYLARQGLALRGHNEKQESSNKGNFLELCELFCKFDNNFNVKYHAYLSYTSHDIQNEILNIVSNSTIKVITNEIRKCGKYSLMCDEARSFKEEQLSLCVRYCNGFEICERFIKFIDCSQSRDAESLKNIIINELKQLEIADIPIVAQTYDGASVMSGAVGGLQTKIREKYPTAVYFHCAAHKLALVVTDTCKNIRSSVTFFNLLESLYIHFSQPFNHSTFILMQKKLGLKPLKLTQLSTTRWACRYKNCNNVKMNYESIINTLEEEINNNKNKYAIEAVGLLKGIKKAQFIFNLFVFHDILLTIDLLSQTLQKKNMTLGQATSAINGVISTLQDKRSDKSFKLLWDDITNFSKKFGICLNNEESSKKRKPVDNQRLNNSLVTSTIGSREDNLTGEKYWKANVYNTIIDNITNRMKTRFSDESQKLAKSIDNFFILDFDGSLEFIEYYSHNLKIKMDVLKAEMMIVNNYLNSQIKNWTIQDLLSTVTLELYPNLHNLLQVALSIPVSSASCERSFSAMRRIKNWLRTSMIQNRFSNLAIIHIENELVKTSIESKQILEEFVKCGSRRIQLTL